MKRISILIFSIVVLTSFGLTKQDTEEYAPAISLETVNQIHLAGNCAQTDSCRGTPYPLTNLMAEDLIDRLNKSDSKEPCADSAEYFLYIDFMEGPRRDFIINGSSIQENNGRCFDIKDADYFGNLWVELDKIAVE